MHRQLLKIRGHLQKRRHSLREKMLFQIVEVCIVRRVHVCSRNWPVLSFFPLLIFCLDPRREMHSPVSQSHFVGTYSAKTRIRFDVPFDVKDGNNKSCWRL